MTAAPAALASDEVRRAGPAAQSQEPPLLLEFAARGDRFPAAGTSAVSDEGRRADRAPGAKLSGVGGRPGR
jgi:hypothetical protein